MQDLQNKLQQRLDRNFFGRVTQQKLGHLSAEKKEVLENHFRV
jgi:hypothetical protein